MEQQIPYPRAWAQRSRGDLACKHVDVTNTSIRPAIEGYMRKTAHRHKCGGRDGTGQTQGPPEKPRTVVREGRKVGRNEPCPCGSGKKYKQCHGKLD